MRDIICQTGVERIDQADSTLSKLSTLLLEDITSNKIVRERLLLDFSKQIVKTIEKSELAILPDSFSALADYIDEYMRYDAEDETDVRRTTAYSRVFQITQMLHIHIKEAQKDLLLENAINQNRNNLKLLLTVSNAPWITHKELSRELGISPPALTNKISPLEKDGFVMSLRQGRQKHYFLTEQGEVLKFKLSEAGGARAISSLCSFEKEQLFFAFVKVMQLKPIENVLSTARQLIPYIENMDEQQTKYLLSKIRCWIQYNDRQKERNPQRKMQSQYEAPVSTNYLPSTSILNLSIEDKPMSYIRYASGLEKADSDIPLYKASLMQKEESSSWSEHYVSKY